MLSLAVMNTAWSKSVEMRSAEIYLSQGDYHKAMEFFQKEVANNPDNYKAYYNMGLIYREWNDYREMSEMFDKSLAIKDKYYDEIIDIRDELWIKFFNDAVEPFNQGEYQKALELFDMAVVIDPERIDGWKQRGLCCLQMAAQSTDTAKTALFEKAVSDFKQVIAMDTENEQLDIRLNLAMVYTELNDHQNAIPALQEVLEFDPENAEALSKLALIYHMEGKSEKAIEQYEKALKKQPDNSDLLFNLGGLYFKIGEDAKASIDEMEGTGEQTESMEVLREKKDKYYDLAVNSFKKAAEFTGEDTEVLWNLVNSLWRIERFAETIPPLEKLSELEPENPEVWRFLSIAYTKNGEFKKGKNALQRFKGLSGQ